MLLRHELLRCLRRKIRRGTAGALLRRELLDAAWARWQFVVMLSVVGVCYCWLASLDGKQTLLEFATLIVKCGVKVGNETLLPSVVTLLLCGALCSALCSVALLLCDALCSVALLLCDALGSVALLLCGATLQLRGTFHGESLLLCGTLSGARDIRRANLLELVKHECDGSLQSCRRGGQRRSR